jgi:hypothetical protein
MALVALSASVAVVSKVMIVFMVSPFVWRSSFELRGLNVRVPPFGVARS